MRGFIRQKGDGLSVAQNGDWTIKPWAVQEYFKLASGLTNNYTVHTIEAGMCPPDPRSSKSFEGATDHSQSAQSWLSSFESEK